MKYLSPILFSALMLFSGDLFGQLSDDFSDGNFTELPPWNGETENFMVNASNQLQLAAPAKAGVAFLSTPSEISKNAAWTFYIKLQFNPSSNNYVDVYLMSDHENLKNSLNGYFVRIGDTQDELSLYRQTGDKSSAIKIIDGLDDRVDFSKVELNIKVTKDSDGSWELFVDPALDGQYLSEGSVVDHKHLYALYFGIHCTYTATRSDKFFFDDLLITGEINRDLVAPELDSLMVLSDSTLQINFSEAIAPGSATFLNNYYVTGNIGNPKFVEHPYDSVLVLFFQQKFEDQVWLELTVMGIQDLFSNTMDQYKTNFTYLAPFIPGFGNLIITEIMADPSPEVDLPEYEFLEMYNVLGRVCDISEVKLVVGKDTAILSDFVIQPNEYIILCQSGAVGSLERYGRVLKVAHWPSLNNRGEGIMMLNENEELIFSLEYDDSWYRSIEKDDGGWSLEMIDVDFPCKAQSNWTASSDPSGGTPGRENASSEALIDFSGPEITGIFATSKASIALQLDEKIPPQHIDTENITIDPGLQINQIMLQSPTLDRLAINFSDTIASKTSYELVLKNLHDCPGNVSKASSASFVLPELADSADLLINEILFNPLPGGLDFVEIYNQSDKYIDLNKIQIGNKVQQPITADHLVMAPLQFIVLTENLEVLSNYHPNLEKNNAFEIPDLPPFNDDEGKVFLLDQDGDTLDFFQYDEDFHSPFLRETEGVSLERISFSGPTNNKNNWQSASSTAGYATPGKMNSQYLADILDNEEVTIEPHVFDPGNNGFHDFTTIKCRFSSSGNMATIKIADASGRLVKTILSHESIGAEEDFKWEGTDDNGREVRMGYYVVYVDIYNATGGRKIYRKKVVVGGTF